MKKKVLIVCANYYEGITFSLRADAEKILNSSKIKCDHLNVPGIFEIPVSIVKNIKKYDGFVALGCVIKGETPHFDFISKSTFDAIMNLSIQYKKPIGNGIITALNLNQAKIRSGDSGKFSSFKDKKKGKGIESAIAVVDVLKNETKRS
tara:strand:- start:3085 stop:3531 length:447 start_codon:yes stop_codon:yes gene_type:complete